MSGRHRPGIPLCLLALVFLLSGCATARSDRKPAVPDAQPSPRAESSPRVPDVQPLPAAESSPRVQAQLPSKPPTQAPVRKPTTPPQEPSQPSPNRLVEAGEYQKALEEYGVRHRKYPRDQALTTEYAKSVEEMKSAADKACDEKQFAAAGRTYDVLLKRYAQFKDFAHLLTFNNAYLNQKLSLCKRSLSVLGFQEYRKGNLNEAIVMWRGLLMIDPNNEDIKKAVNTATQQQKNLQKKK